MRQWTPFGDQADIPPDPLTSEPPITHLVDFKMLSDGVLQETPDIPSLCAT